MLKYFSGKTTIFFFLISIPWIEEREVWKVYNYLKQLYYNTIIVML